jgi:hypothetical protein
MRYLPEVKKMLSRAQSISVVKSHLAEDQERTEKDSSVGSTVEVFMRYLPEVKKKWYQGLKSIRRCQITLGRGSRENRKGYHPSIETKKSKLMKE